jgi:hypothetical protein
MSRPATFLIDSMGIIRFQYRAKNNSSFDQPSVDQVLQAIDGLGKTKK